MFSASPSKRAEVYGLVLYSTCFRSDRRSCRAGGPTPLRASAAPLAPRTFWNGILGWLQDTVESTQNDHRKHDQAILRRPGRSPAGSRFSRSWISVLRACECLRLAFSFLAADHTWLRGNLAVLIHGSMTSIPHPVNPAHSSWRLPALFHESSLARTRPIDSIILT